MFFISYIFLSEIPASINGDIATQKFVLKDQNTYNDIHKLDLAYSINDTSGYISPITRSTTNISLSSVTGNTSQFKVKVLFPQGYTITDHNVQLMPLKTDGTGNIDWDFSIDNPFTDEVQIFSLFNRANDSKKEKDISINDYIEMLTDESKKDSFLKLRSLPIDEYKKTKANYLNAITGSCIVSSEGRTKADIKALNGLCVVDFDDVEGIDLDDEQNRFRRVLRFKDCYNFEVPVDDMYIEDFIYLTNNKNIEQAVDDVLESVSKDALSKSDSSFDLSAFLNNLINNFIINLPKALVMSILSAKIFLPIIILYKIFKTGLTNIYLNSKELAKKFYKALGNIIKDLFWLFIREFWKLIKTDLLSFIQTIVQRIIKNKYKRYLLIITSLIVLLKKLLQNEINNCYDLFQTILSTINAALSQKAPITVPSILLLFSESLPGFSQDRAFMNIMNKLEASGVPTGPLYGESNKIGDLVKSIIDGHTEEKDANSFVKIVLKGGVLPGPPLAGGAVIPPGLISGVGKEF